VVGGCAGGWPTRAAGDAAHGAASRAGEHQGKAQERGRCPLPPLRPLLQGAPQRLVPQKPPHPSCCCQPSQIEQRVGFSSRHGGEGWSKQDWIFISECMSVARPHTGAAQRALIFGHWIGHSI